MSTATLRPNPSERKTIYFADGTSVDCYAFVDDNGAVVEWHPLSGNNPDAFEALIGGSANPESKLDTAGHKTTSEDLFRRNEKDRAELAAKDAAKRSEEAAVEGEKAAKARESAVAAAMTELKGLGLSDATLEVLGLSSPAPKTSKKG